VYAAANPVTWSDPSGHATSLLGRILVDSLNVGIGSITLPKISAFAAISLLHILMMLELVGLQDIVDELTDEDENEDEDLIYLTYTLTHPGTGKVYSGYTSGTGLPRQIMMKRYSGHHKVAQGYIIPGLDKWLKATTSKANRHSDPSYQAIRGREQQLCDYYGGSQRDGGSSGNDIRPVGCTNARRHIYHNAANAAFGQLHAYTCPN